MTTHTAPAHREMMTKLAKVIREEYAACELEALTNHMRTTRGGLCKNLVILDKPLPAKSAGKR